MELNKESWKIIMDKLKEFDNILYGLVREAKPVKFDGNYLHLKLENDKIIHNKIINNRIKEIKEIANSVLTNPIDLIFFRKGQDIERVIKLFDGEIIEVNLEVLNL
ncbi:MAG: hypothetical protein ACOCZ5_01050 [bacterium]